MEVQFNTNVIKTLRSRGSLCACYDLFDNTYTVYVAVFSNKACALSTTLSFLILLENKIINVTSVTSLYKIKYIKKNTESEVNMPPPPSHMGHVRTQPTYSICPMFLMSIGTRTIYCDQQCRAESYFNFVPLGGGTLHQESR